MILVFCKGRKWTRGHNQDHAGCGTCYCCAPSTGPAPGPAGDLPRLTHINYDPGVFVMLREVGGGGAPLSPPAYFYASNSSTFELVDSGSATFYQALLAVQQKYNALLAPAMKVEVPAFDQRQIDMATASLLATMNNFVGNQPNYGNGATYWSYGREDNGSLPLDMLSVDEALLGWGMCSTVLEHVDFYFDNYVGDDGRTIYGCCGWPNAPDSLSDYGRLVDLYIRVVDLCDPPAAWATKQLGAVTRMSTYMLKLHVGVSPPPPPSPPGPPGPPVACTFGPEQKQTYIAGTPSGGAQPSATLAAAQALCTKTQDCGGITYQYDAYQLRSGHAALPNPPKGKSAAESWLVTNAEVCHSGDPATAGLVLGAPEHDWSRTQNLAFYNNNAWLATGMHRIGTFLMKSDPHLARALLGNASTLTGSLQSSLKACMVLDSNGAVVFAPPYAHANATPYTSMTESREASYTNFRFWSETMMADIIPAAIEVNWLDFHNNKGGRFGGANRFEGWLDDMPTAGWGYGALANNMTDDFMGLLYGHAATYQTPGTFHSTEQLSFHGTGRYRGFNHITDIVPDGPTISAAQAAEMVVGDKKRLAVSLSASPDARVRHPMYNGIENDVSFCIVSNILVARMTRWQLVMEDRRAAPHTTIWLGKGAPARWFLHGGFNVTSAPTSVGRISYRMLPHAPGYHAPGYRVSPHTSHSQGATLTATYSVDLSAAKARAVLDTLWGVRYPSKLSPGSVQCSGCAIAAEDTASGMVKVSPTKGTVAFSVTATWVV